MPFRFYILIMFLSVKIEATKEGTDSNKISNVITPSRHFAKLWSSHFFFFKNWLVFKAWWATQKPHCVNTPRARFPWIHLLLLWQWACWLFIVTLLNIIYLVTFFGIYINYFHINSLQHLKSRFFSFLFINFPLRRQIFSTLILLLLFFSRRMLL